MSNGRIHIEAPGTNEGHIAREYRKRLAELPAVGRVEVNAVLQCIVVFPDGEASVEELISAIREIEDDHDLAASPSPDRDHPGDPLLPAKEMASIAANTTGAVLSAIGRTARLPRLPILVPALASLAEANTTIHAAPHPASGARPPT